ncbi:MAG: hypothetical protein LBG64_03860 [Pseudomonadales bacterium]|jgi:hypothetical protein|nr:hypothetical protein [Pseudomonadales bacterium]
MKNLDEKRLVSVERKLKQIVLKDLGYKNNNLYRLQVLSALGKLHQDKNYTFIDKKIYLPVIFASHWHLQNTYFDGKEKTSIIWPNETQKKKNAVLTEQFLYKNYSFFYNFEEIDQIVDLIKSDWAEEFADSSTPQTN